MVKSRSEVARPGPRKLSLVKETRRADGEEWADRMSRGRSVEDDIKVPA